MFIILITDFFLLRVLCESDLSISTAEKHTGIVIIKHFKPGMTTFFHIIDQIRILIVPLKIRHCHEESLEIVLTVPLNIYK